MGCVFRLNSSLVQRMDKDPIVDANQGLMEYTYTHLQLILLGWFLEWI